MCMTDSYIFWGVVTAVCKEIISALSSVIASSGMIIATLQLMTRLHRPCAEIATLGAPLDPRV